MYYSDSRLFDSETSMSFLNSRMTSMRTEILSLKTAIFESNTVEEIERNFYQKYEIEPIELLVDQKELEVDEIDILRDATRDPFYNPIYDSSTYTIRGYGVTVNIPFTGYAELFKLKPSRYIMRTFDASIYTDNFDKSQQFLRLKTEFEKVRVDDNIDVIKNKIDDELKSYIQNIAYVNADAINYNKQLKDEVSKSIKSRLSDLNKLKSIKTALKIPLRKNTSPSSLNKISIKPKIISPLATKPTEIGAYISEDDYDIILSSIRSMGASMESNRAAENQDEEGLRDILLTGLSTSIVIGTASGESFRKNGKTDILVMFENKAAFIAECKIWKGRDYINKGIDQLLGYTTWRDVKISYVIFNKDVKNFSKIQEQISNIFSEREDFVKTERNQREGEWRFTLQKPDDKSRHITIHIFLFDVKANEKR